MTMEELHKQLKDNRDEIERVSNMIDNMHKLLKNLLEKDTDLYYQILKVQDPDEYAKLVKGFRITDVRD